MAYHDAQLDPVMYDIGRIALPVTTNSLLLEFRARCRVALKSGEE